MRSPFLQIKQLEKKADLSGKWSLKARRTSREGKSRPEIIESAEPEFKSSVASARLFAGRNSISGNVSVAFFAIGLFNSGNKIFIPLL